MRNEGYCSWVCQSVCLLSHISPMEESVHPENAVTYSTGNEGQNICWNLAETTTFKRFAAKHERKSQYANYSDLPAVSFLQHTASARGYPAIVKNILPCPQQCLLMLLAHVRVRTDNIMHYSCNTRHDQFPHTCIGVGHNT